MVGMINICGIVYMVASQDEYGFVQIVSTASSVCW